MAIKYVGPNALKKLCSLVKTALAGKINTSDIVQTTSESSSAKVPSAAVTNDLQDQVDELNTNSLKETTIDRQTISSADNLPANSICWVNPSGVSGGIANLPTQSAYHIITAYTSSDAYGFQLAQHYIDGTLWSRAKHNDTWGKWFRFRPIEYYTKTVSSITIPTAGYVKVWDLNNDLPSSYAVLGVSIVGWQDVAGANYPFYPMFSTDGKSVYITGKQNATIGSVTLRVMYTPL